MMNILYSMIMCMNFLFMNMTHPLAMGLTVLMQTILIAMLTGLVSKTFWFSYILFLIFVGGMLVLFIYVTSLASNEMFSMSMKTLIFTMIIMLMTLILMILYSSNNLPFFLENNEMTSTFNDLSFNKETNLELTKIYNYPTNMMTIILISYLLITLIAIVKISKLFSGPLRMMS